MRAKDATSGCCENSSGRMLEIFLEEAETYDETQVIDE